MIVCAYGKLAVQERHVTAALPRRASQVFVLFFSRRLLLTLLAEEAPARLPPGASSGFLQVASFVNKETAERRAKTRSYDGGKSRGSCGLEYREVRLAAFYCPEYFDALALLKTR